MVKIKRKEIDYIEQDPRTSEWIISFKPELCKATGQQVCKAPQYFPCTKLSFEKGYLVIR